jgi:biopolymer transport protein ExbB
MTLSDTHALFLASFDRGGLVMWPILFVSGVIFYVGFDRLLTILRIGRARRRFLETVNGSTSAMRGVPSSTHPPHPNLMRAFEELLAALPRIQAGHWILKYRYRELLLTVVPELERGFAKMAAWIAAAPLLGLLGTVVGMVETFEVINAFGIGNPHLMAQGISKALLTTQAGLTVAFPALIFRVFLANRKKRLVQLLLSDEETIAHRLGLTRVPATGGARG